jgi:hypothetical protein
MTWPQATREDHERFCQVEGWRRVRDAKGRTGTHHVTYELALPDGQVLRTRISHPPDRTTYGPSLWAHILRDQLSVTQEVFWACVRDGISPDRGVPAVPPEALPADLVHLLITRVGLAEAEVRQLTKPEAIARLQQYWVDDRLQSCILLVLSCEAGGEARA